MHDEGLILAAIGILFLGGLALDAFGRIVHVPRVTLVMLLGAFLGPPVLDILPTALSNGNGLYTDFALTMVAFLLGSALSRDALRDHGREIMFLSITVVLATATVVTIALMVIGLPTAVALLMGGIAAATAPTATLDVIKQVGREGRFASNLMGIVAIDDAWGLLLFSVLLSIATFLSGSSGAGGGTVLSALFEAGGGLILGAVLGIPAAMLTGRLKPGEPSLIEALGVVFLCCGLSVYLGVSTLLTGMMCGAVIANMANHHERPFHEIERIEWPFLLLFFVMAGASLDVGALSAVGVAGAVFVVSRFVGRLLGGWSGALLAGLPAREGTFMGLALMPQAGVAIGMALVAGEHLPHHRDLIVTLTLATTIIFEIIGPFMTQYALKQMPGEPRAESAD